jgi:phosphocarrier protein
MGLHASPASALSNKALKFKSSIELEYNGSKVDVKSILGLMSLGIPSEAFIKIYADGEDEERALKAMQGELRESGMIE